MGTMQNTPNTDNIDPIVSSAIDALPEKVTLGYVDYRDQLNDDQIRMVLDNDFEALYESVWEWEADMRRDAMFDLAIDFERDNDCEDELRESEDFEWFEEACYDRDDFDVIGELTRNTPAQPMRYCLDYDVEPSEFSNEDDNIAVAQVIAAHLGIDYETNANMLRSLTVEASYGGRLKVLHLTELSDLEGATSVTFTDPHILVYDGLNGSGSMEQVWGEVTVNLARDGAVALDKGRMSWTEDIAGIYTPALLTDAKFVTESNDGEAASE